MFKGIEEIFSDLSAITSFYNTMDFKTRFTSNIVTTQAANSVPNRNPVFLEATPTRQASVVRSTARNMGLAPCRKRGHKTQLTWERLLSYWTNFMVTHGDSD
jgi:hypothetical protein